MVESEREVYKYLDMRTGGRKEITFSRRNIMTNYHNKEVSIKYTLTSLDHWFKPLILVFYVFCVFLFMIALFGYSESDGSDSKKKKD